MRIDQGALGNAARECAALRLTSTGRGNKGPMTPAHAHQPVVLQLAVCLSHGVRVDAQIGRHLTHRRESVVRPQVAERDRASNLIDDLDIDRAPAAGIDMDVNPCTLRYSVLVL